MVDLRLRHTLLVISVAVTGCGDDGGGDDTSCLPECAGDRSYDAVAYTLEAHFDWVTETLDAHEEIVVNIGASPIIELDAAVTVTGVRAGERQLAFAADPDTARLRVDVTPILESGGLATFVVDYTAPTSSALRVGGARDDDPVATRVVFTDSEPDRGSLWLVAKHDPSDRAVWGARIEVASGEDVIANGARITDNDDGTTRSVRYLLADQPIPTYLMAFAAGDLVHADRTTGRVPLAVWYRRGLAIDPDATLDVVADAMATFEDRVGPYPWNSYAVVLAPGYGGGMENATITFNAETSGQGNVSFGLNAHELAHHWFGDWVTMRTYDDVWVKEGMATLLAAEADRARRDRTTAAARLFGYDFTFDPNDAIVDPDLTGQDKYTSGPYQRAAWLITQIRYEVGEAAFWASLRDVLAAHALDSITGAEFIASFPLDPAMAARALASLPTREVPVITAGVTPGGASSTVALSITDPGATLIAPIEITTIDAAGAVTTDSLAPGTPVTTIVPDGGYLALDEADVHPAWGASFELIGDVQPLRQLDLPSAAPAIAALTSRSAGTQERVLGYGSLPSIDPAEVIAVYDALDSTIAQRNTVLGACDLASALPPAEGAAMMAALAPAFATPPLRSYSPGFGSCHVGAGAIATELAGLVDTVTPATAGRLEYLLGFDVGLATALDVIGRVATTAPSLRLRDVALRRLVGQAAGYYAYPTPSPAQIPAWQAFFRGRLASTTSEGRLVTLWGAVYALADFVALPDVAHLLHSVAPSEDTQLGIVCEAAALTAGSPTDWAAFQAAAMPWDTLAPGAAAALADPATCPQKPARSANRRAGGGELIPEP